MAKGATVEENRSKASRAAIRRRSALAQIAARKKRKMEQESTYSGSFTLMTDSGRSPAMPIRMIHRTGLFNFLSRTAEPKASKISGTKKKSSRYNAAP